MSRVFTLQVTYPGSTLGIPYGSLRMSGVISKHRAKNNPECHQQWPKNQETNTHTHTHTMSYYHTTQV